MAQYVGPSLPGVAQPAPATAAATGQAGQVDLVNLAKRLAQQIIDPQLAAAKGILSNADRQSLNMRGAYDALAAIRRQEQGDTQRAYQTAAGAQSAFSKGYSDAMQAKLNGQAGSLNEFLGKLGAPQGQMLDTNGHAGDVTYGLAGAIPAGSLAAQGAAAGAYAAQQPGNAVAAGLAQQRVIQGNAQTDYRGALSKINASAPGIVQGQLSSLQKQAYAAASGKNTVSPALSKQMGQYVNRFGEPIVGTDGRPVLLPSKNTAQKIDLAVSKSLGYYADSTGAAILKDGSPVKVSEQPKMQRVDIGVSKQLGYLSDASGAPVLVNGKVRAYRAAAKDNSRVIAQADVAAFKAMGVVATLQQGSDGSLVAVPKIDPRTGTYALTSAERTKAKRERFTPLQVENFKGMALSGALAAKNGIPAKLDSTGNEVPGSAHPALSYDDAIVQGRAAGIPMKFLLPALNEVYKPGEQGRPVPPGQQRAIDNAASSWGRLPGVRVEVPATASPFARAVLGEADKWLGTPYSWGGGGPGGPSYGIAQGRNTKGFDCSSFAQYLYSKAGVAIPRTTYEQWRIGDPIPRIALQPGDLVFFRPGKRGPEHEGIYVGDNKFIESPSTGKTVRVSSMDSRSDFMGGRRINV